MAGVFTKAKRSEVMSRIRSRWNKATELALAKFFRRHHITGWRRHVQVRGRARRSARAVSRNSKSGAHGVTRPTFHVRPDFIFSKFKLAVFADGCFWHGCPRHGTQPKDNRAFWRRKLAGNKARDRRVNRALRAQGWRVVRIWECELAKLKKTSTPHPKPSPPAPLPSDGRGWRRDLPGRGGEGAEARLLQRIRPALK